VKKRELEEMAGLARQLRAKLQVMQKLFQYMHFLESIYHQTAASHMDLILVSLSSFLISYSVASAMKYAHFVLATLFVTF
jgi:hypothetical protein